MYATIGKLNNNFINATFVKLIFLVYKLAYMHTRSCSCS